MSVGEMSGEPWGNLGRIFLKDFLRDVGGTFRDVEDVGGTAGAW
jgi:hypothetical protein